MVLIFGKKIQFVPILHTPLSRRLETVAVTWYTSTYVLPVASCLLWIVLLFTGLFWISLGYLAWVLYDNLVRRISSRGGRRWETFRRCRFWKSLRNYFPVYLVKTAELKPNRNYILGYHPHGIFSYGAFTNFVTEATGFSTLFPGIRPHTLTIRANFIWPLIREYLLWLGNICIFLRKGFMPLHPHLWIYNIA